MLRNDSQPIHFTEMQLCDVDADLGRTASGRNIAQIVWDSHQMSERGRLIIQAKKCWGRDCKESSTIKGEVRSQKSKMSFSAVQDQATQILSEANWEQNISRLKSSIITHLLQRITQKLQNITSLIPTKNKNHTNPPLLPTSLSLSRSP